MALPKVADARKFAQQRIELAGFVAISELPRLQQVVVDDSTRVEVKLSFGQDEQRRKLLTGSAEGAVILTCQRCLEPVTVPVACDIALAIVWDEEQAANLPKSLDPWIVAEEGASDLYQMVEEELLLALPAVAYHSHMCVPEALYSSGDGEVEAKTDKQNPFQVLEQLKGSPKS